MSHDNRSSDQVTANQITPSNQPPVTPRSRVCRFFNTNKGCRAGAHCPYQHVQPGASTRQKHDPRQTVGEAERSTAGGNIGGKAETPLRPFASQKPVSQLERTNPRQFQIGQVIKRFSPSQKEVNDASILSFTLNPSDPDFPFELAGLHCSLTIPASYPQNGTPSLRVTNSEMARGFQINVEKGFEALATEEPRKPLLALLNDLDKNLEKFLTAEKAQTIKIVANADKKSNLPEVVPQVVQTILPQPEKVDLPAPSWSAEQLSDAKAKRQSDVRQLEARMGRLSGFSKSSDGTRFNIPVQIANAARLPVSLQPLKEVTLIVPKLYNLLPCTVHLNGVYGSEVENVQLSFEKRVLEQPDMTLMAHVNYLIQNVHNMAAEALKTIPLLPTTPELPQPPAQEVSLGGTVGEAEEGARILDPDHPHVMVIPRPPEWDHHGSNSEYESDSYDSDSYTESEDEYDEDDGGMDGGATLPDTSAKASSPSPEKGILLSFPSLELHGIELLTLSTLSLSVKCLRCKTSLDVFNIKPSLINSTPAGSSHPTTSIRTESCPKCASSFEMTFTPQLLHQHSIRAGTIEATGCTIADLLPSTFQPTCSACSTPFPSPPGMVSVRGDTPIQVCRSCHSKMTFTIPEVKFLRLSSSSRAPQDLPLRKPKRENLGVTTGNPLPSNGTCTHYAHSYRWFRFSCCGRVHPCDRCHDAAEAHANDRAERMLCGWCSREQRFRPEDCGFCGRSVVRRRRAGGAGRFWEGGKGTRERGLMSRKEKRKYKHKRSEGTAQGAKKG